MALSIDYTTNIIFVPKADTQFVSTNPQTGLEIRQLNLTPFAQAVADLQDDPEGAWASTAFTYTAPVSVGGVQLAPVVVILSPYTVEFEDGQYAVNLNGANTNLQDAAVVNQVSIRPNNSAGLTFSDAIDKQSFQGGAVWVDSIDGGTGVVFPRGTTSDPVNNPTDAVTIAIANNLHKFEIQGTFVVPSGLAVNRYTVFGNNPADAIIIFDNNDISGSGFERINAVGSISGRGAFKDCSVGKTLGLTGAQGIFDNCGIAGDITLEASATEPIVFKDCISAIAGTAKPQLDCNGTVAGINFRRYAGGLAIVNFNNPAGTMTLDLMGSEVSLDSANCTDGEIVARGVGRLIDENGDDIQTGTWNGITIKNQLRNDKNNADAVWNALIGGGTSSAGSLLKFIENMTGGRVTRSGDNITVYDREDDSTIIAQFDLTNGERIPQ